MAFALSKANAYQLKNWSSGFRQNVQVIELTITRANTDTDLDLFDSAGTFWTAVGSSDVGKLAKDTLTPIFSQVAFILGCEVIGNAAPLIRVASAPGATSYVLGNEGTYPEVKPVITLVSGSGATSLKIALLLSLNDMVQSATL